jgi:DNA-binding NarL/FixJ family response regulator
METMKIVFADDHPLFRDGLRLLLEGVADLEIVGEAGSGEEAIALCAALQPDVVLMDLNMPGVNGIDATRAILRTSPHIGILVITMFDDDDSVFAAMQAGARGYLLKGASKEETLRAIRAVGSGEAIFSQGIAKKLIQYFSSLATGASAAPLFPELTEREREILRFIAQGLNNGDIAAKTSLSMKTVRNHVSNIFNKLQVADRAQAIIRAREAGLR